MPCDRRVEIRVVHVQDTEYKILPASKQHLGERHAMDFLSQPRKGPWVQASDLQRRETISFHHFLFIDALDKVLQFLFSNCRLLEYKNSFDFYKYIVPLPCLAKIHFLIWIVSFAGSTPLFHFLALLSQLGLPV